MKDSVGSIVGRAEVSRRGLVRKLLQYLLDDSHKIYIFAFFVRYRKLLINNLRFFIFYV